MTPKHLCILFLAIVAASKAAAQSNDIPIENDNQFPPDDNLETGSGEEPTSSTATTLSPQIEEIQLAVLTEKVSATPESDKLCPSPCVCHVEQDKFVVNCAGFELTEFPAPIDSRTTTLYIQNNKLTDIPKDLSELKNLEVLNAENNSIMDLTSGSISELTNLVVLKLAKNRLVEYPKDLKNSFSLTKLEELDLGGNDMRSELKLETFSNFNSLRKLTLPEKYQEFLKSACASSQENLEVVCIESCSTQQIECENNKEKIDDGDMEATLPGVIAFETADNADPIVNTDDEIATDETPIKETTNANSVTTETAIAGNENNTSINGNSVGLMRANVDKELVEETVVMSNAIVETKDESNKQTETDVKLGETKTDTTGGGGVDKSVIGFIVAGMVVVVAGITIKKNWSSIKKRFSSTPRPHERAGANANGTTPEEVPLQEKDKSPV